MYVELNLFLPKFQRYHAGIGVVMNRGKMHRLPFPVWLHLVIVLERVHASEYDSGTYSKQVFRHSI